MAVRQVVTQAVTHPHLQVVAHSSVALTHDGLALLAVSAILLAVGLLVQGMPRGLNGTPMGRPRPEERKGWTISLAGAIGVVAGSVLVLIGNWPSVGFVVTAVVGLALVAAAAYWGGFVWYVMRHDKA